MKCQIDSLFDFKVTAYLEPLHVGHVIPAHSFWMECDVLHEGVNQVEICPRFSLLLDNLFQGHLASLTSRLECNINTLLFTGAMALNVHALASVVFFINFLVEDSHLYPSSCYRPQWLQQACVLPPHLPCRPYHTLLRVSTFLWSQVLSGRVSKTAWENLA